MGQYQIGAEVSQGTGQAGHGGRMESAGGCQPARQGQGPVDADSVLPVEETDQGVPAIGASELVDQGPGEDLGSPAERGRDDVKDPRVRGVPTRRTALAGFGPW